MFKIICVIVASLSLAACQNEQSITPKNQVNANKAISADPPVGNGSGGPR
jgi:hypothetical protein